MECLFHPGNIRQKLFSKNRGTLWRALGVGECGFEVFWFERVEVEVTNTQYEMRTTRSSGFGFERGGTLKYAFYR